MSSKGSGYRLLHGARAEPWTQITARLLSPEGLLVAVCYPPWLHDEGDSRGHMRQAQVEIGHPKRTISTSGQNPAPPARRARWCGVLAGGADHLPRSGQPTYARLGKGGFTGVDA